MIQALGLIDRFTGDVDAQFVEDVLVHVHVSEPDRSYPGKTGGEYLKQFALALGRTSYRGRVSVECTFADFPTDSGEAYKFVAQTF